jgi:cellobiose epimerase
MKSQLNRHLKKKIIPFWNRMRDIQNGGFYGYVGLDLSIDQQADKGAVKIARILWSYSALYRHYLNKSYLEHAKHAYQYIIQNLYDEENEGVFWKTNYKGEVINNQKHIYAQSFALYAFCEYYMASKDAKALDYAMRIYNVIELKAFQPQLNSYEESFNCKWEKVENTFMGTKSITPNYSTNAVLHLIEAYTNLCKVTENNAINEKLKQLVILFHEKIYDHEHHVCHVFFDEKWQPMSKITSYGHDIEAAWLIDDALKTINYRDSKLSLMTKNLAEKVFSSAYEEGFIISETNDHHTNGHVIWWVQAEAAVGFLNHYQKTKNHDYFIATKKTWKKTMKLIVDQRKQGEWFWAVDRQGKPYDHFGISENWKANYHNVRACLELIKRKDEL